MAEFPKSLIDDEPNTTKRGAFSVEGFSEWAGVSRATTYREIRVGRLVARKIGKRTIITLEDGQNFLRRLPRL